MLFADQRVQQRSHSEKLPSLELLVNQVILELDGHRFLVLAQNSVVKSPLRWSAVHALKSLLLLFAHFWLVSFFVCLASFGFGF